ncbi:MAG: OadG family protein [Acutalibacteraceae bacterium]
MLTVRFAAAMNGNTVLGMGDTLLVCALGVGIVFAGLICIVLICKLMSFLTRLVGSDSAAPAAAKAAAAPAAPAPAPAVPAEKRGEFIAAVSAAIAEDLGTSVDAIKITSVKQL